MADFDAVEKKRIDQYRKTDGDYSHVFKCEGVVKTLYVEKSFLSTYDEKQVLGLLPFTPIQYSMVCPGCIGKANFPKFEALVRHGRIIPVLRAPYAEYPEAIRNVVVAHDHVSVHEFEFFRVNNIPCTTESHARGHAAIDEMESIVAGRRNEETYLEEIHHLAWRFMPYPETDLELFRIANDACKSRKLGSLKKLSKMGSAIYELRSAQAFKAAPVIGRAELGSLPNFGPETSEASRVSEDLQQMAAEGLGIRIPLDIPIEQYIEIAMDYQPRISEALKGVMPNYRNANTSDLSKKVSSLNREVQRLKSLKRYAVMEACVGFYKGNGPLYGGALLAAAMGIAGSILGCVAVSTVAGTKIAKRKGWLKENAALARLGRMISRDLQPYTDVLLKTYLGGTDPAINVLSLQRRISAATGRK